MSGAGTRWTVLIALVTGVIGVVTLVAVGLLPGQASNEPVRASAPAGTTVPLGALGVGPIPSRPTSTTSPAAATTSSTSVAPEATSAPVTATTEVASAAGGPGTTTPTTAAPAAPPVSSSATTPTTSGASGGGSSPPAVDDPTCSILQEILGLVDDPGVRQAIRDEMRSSGCPT